MRRLVLLLIVALTTGVAWAGGDGIDLLLGQSDTSEIELSWTGGLPAYAIYRSSAATDVTQPASLRAVTVDQQWTGSRLRPAAGEALYFAVGETTLQAGSIAEQWVDGLDCPSEPDIQVHNYNENFVILRQSLCTNFEGPFIYLLFGDDKVLMQDTGAGGIAIANTVYGIIDQWLFDHGKASIELIVTHSHSHGDHTAGDGQFQGQPNTQVVGLSPTAVANFFGITNWPTQIVEYDLGGGRIVDVIPIPGHQAAHIALYDRLTGILFTGDSLYPGRLYIFNSNDFPTYQQSIQRLVDFIADKPVVWDLGTHIEMTTTPFVDFPFGSDEHPNEHELELTRDHLEELLAAVDEMADAPEPFVEAHADFIIFPF